jgi:hypothetical protein
VKLPTRGGFVPRVGQFDRWEITQFVADLSEARDWNVETVGNGRLLLQASRGTTCETLAVRITQYSPATTVDADSMVVGPIQIARLSCSVRGGP